MKKLIAVICELLGTPRRDGRSFSDWTDEIFKIFQFNAVNDEPDILRAFDELDVYLDAMVEARRAEPRDDLVTQLLQAEEEGTASPPRAPHARRRGAAAGTDTTRNQLAAALQLSSTIPISGPPCPSRGRPTEWSTNPCATRRDLRQWPEHCED